MSAVAELPALERWLARVRQIGAHRPHRADYAAYERLKGELVRESPCLTGAEYERAEAVIAKATGVQVRLIWHWIRLRSLAAARWLRDYERAERRHW